jgi:hypothetical protein
MIRERIATALTIAGISVFLLTAGLGLAGQVGWFAGGLVIALILLVSALTIGSYVPKRDRAAR